MLCRGNQLQQQATNYFDDAGQQQQDPLKKPPKSHRNSQFLSKFRSNTNFSSTENLFVLGTPTIRTICSGSWIPPFSKTYTDDFLSVDLF